MTPVFSDTSFYLALFNPRDVWHAEATRWSLQLRPTVVVTEFILLELGNALSRANVRQVFVDLVPHLRSDPNVIIVPMSQELFEQGYTLFANRPDKDWSLTDCISFTVMEQYHLSDALTADHHFEQAGFKILLK